MIEVLKDVTYKKIGFKIKTRGDCHILADMVFMPMRLETIFKKDGLVGKSLKTIR